MDFVLKMMDFVLKMMNSALKMQLHLTNDTTAAFDIALEQVLYLSIRIYNDNNCVKHKNGEVFN